MRVPLYNKKIKKNKYFERKKLSNRDWLCATAQPKSDRANCLCLCSGKWGHVTLHFIPLLFIIGQIPCILWNNGACPVCNSRVYRKYRAACLQRPKKYMLSWSMPIFFPRWNLSTSFRCADDGDNAGQCERADTTKHLRAWRNKNNKMYKGQST